jgi:3-hydroxy-9,10-secoandrosta-1,3,5(10)-triene-9,17-dione monooxygenase
VNTNESAPVRKDAIVSAGHGLVEAAKRLAPALRDRGAEGAALRRLPDSTWRDLIGSGLARALQPARWGGAEAHPREFYNAVCEVARAEGCAGWVLGVIGVHPWQTALFPRQAQEEVWGDDPAAMNSSSYAATGKAEKVSGGYRLSGKWSFSSGCDHCKWVNLGAVPAQVAVDGKQVPDLRSFLLPRKDYRIDDNWRVAGMAGTGSKDIVVDGAFVPDYRSQSHWDYTLGRALPGWELNPAPLYRLPFAVVFNYALSAAVMGAAMGFLDTWIEISRTRRGGYGLNIRDDPFHQKLTAEAAYAIAVGITQMNADCDELMDAAERGESLPMTRRAAMRFNACRSAQAAVEAVDRLFAASSGRAIFLDHPLQRRYQDVKAMLGHAFLNPDVPGRLYGALALGVPVMDLML